MQTTTMILGGTFKWLQKLGAREKWVHLLVWLVPCCIFNVPAFEFTLGVFHGNDYSLWVPSTYGLVLNALIFYGNTYLIGELLRQDLPKFIVLSLLWLTGICLLETILDSAYYFLFYAYLDGAILLDILVGSFLLNAMFFYLPSFVYGVLSGINPAAGAEMKIHIKNGNESVFVSADELFFIESDSNYCIYHTAHGKYVERTSLASLEKVLPPQFIRCHKSFIVNSKLMERQRAKELEIAGHKLPIGRKYKHRLKEISL
jgi:DNA-binding LytR/AlgR family response regulator